MGEENAGARWEALILKNLEQPVDSLGLRVAVSTDGLPERDAVLRHLLRVLLSRQLGDEGDLSQLLEWPFERQKTKQVKYVCIYVEYEQSNHVVARSDTEEANVEI